MVQAARKQGLWIALYGGAVAVSVGLVVAVIARDISAPLMWDAGVYTAYAEQIREGHLLDFYLQGIVLRTYGYPLFLAGFQALGDLLGTDWVRLVVIAQWTLHTVTAGLAAVVFDALAVTLDDRPRRWARWGVFALVQTNLALLTLSQEVMTDSLTVFFVTLLLWLFVSRWRWRVPALGGVLALSMMVRTYHGGWSIVMLVAWVGLVALGTLMAGRVGAWWADTWAVLRRPATWGGVLMAAGLFALVLVPQYVRVQRLTGEWAMVGSIERSHIQWHYTLSSYTYVYETYIGGALSDAPVRYVNDERLRTHAVRAMSLSDLLHDYATHPHEAIHMLVVKLAATFQQHEFNTHRTTLTNSPAHPLFLLGGVMFGAFVYIHQYAVTQARAALLTNWRVMAAVVVVSTYVLAYVGLAQTEARYFMPIVPALAALVMLFVVVAGDWRGFAFALIIASAIYTLAYDIKQDGMAVGRLDAPLVYEPIADYGPFSLLHWVIPQNTNLYACDTVTLETWWDTTAPVEANYSLTMALIGPDGVPVAQTAGALADSETALWPLGAFYRDTRTLEVPCDAPDGDYWMMVYLETDDGNGPLPVSLSDGTPTGQTYSRLGEIRVQPES